MKPQFYCHFTKEHLCETCASATVPDKTGVEKYAYPHNLIYINTKGDETLLKSLDMHKIGVD